LSASYAAALGRVARRGAERDRHRGCLSLALAARMAEHARSRGLTPTQLALGWVWNNTLVNGVIGGPKTIAQWRDYLGALDTPFDAADEAFVSALVSTGHASTPGYNDPQYPVTGRAPRHG
jgi:aryl-alcohol dehydrogenase-like predicted oxidoreductase